MSSVDNRVVKMQFDNATFKKEALATKASLDQVDAAVAKAGKGKGLLDMAGHMETVKVKAGAMQVAAITAISNITNRAVNAGITMAKSLTLDPIKQGFDEYELKMKSIQTILANTDGENLKSVTAALDELNEYSDKTIYNFAEMTKSVGRLTTAGIDLEVATATVKGFANVSALAGASAAESATAMDQFAKGLQGGVIRLQDWMSIENAGISSSSLQEALFEAGKAAGTLADVPLDQTYKEWSQSVGGFRNSLEEGWLTADVATDTMKIMAGEVKTVEELMAMGFTNKAAKDLLQTAADAEESATKVRTFTAFMSTLKEQLGSGWAKVMESIIGDFEEATDLFTGWADTTGRIIGKMFGYIENLAKGFAKFGGQAATLKTIQHILSPILSLVGLLAKGWKAAFGGSETGKGIATFAKLLEQLTRPLNILGKLLRGQLTPMEAFFRLLEWGGNLIKKAGGFIGGLVDKVLGLVGLSIPKDTGIIGWLRDMGREIKAAIDKIQGLIEKGESLQDSLGKVDIKLPKLPKLPGLPEMGSILGGNDDSSKIAGLVGGVDVLKGKLLGVKSASDAAGDTPMFNPEADISAGRVSDISDAMGDLATNTSESATVGEKVAPAVEGAWGALKKFFEGFNVEDLMAAFNLAVLSTFMISISRFMNTMSESFKGFVGTGEAVNGILTSASGALDAYADGQKAKLIWAYAAAIAILALSLWLLSKIPADQLVTGLAGLAGIMMIMKTGVDSITKSIDAMDGKNTTFKLTALSLALVALGVAILLLATAFLILNKVDWSSMLKGLLTIVVVMKMMEALGKVGQHGAKNLLGAAVALGALAVSMLILAGALLLFKLVDWESMAKGGLVLTAMVLGIGLLAMIPYAGIAKVGVAMLAASVGMLAIANALVIFGLVSWESIGKAAVVLTMLTLSLALLMFVGNPVTISGIIGLSVAMIGLSVAMMMLNNVEWASIAKIGVVMAILLVAFAGFLALIYLAAPVLPLLTGLALSLALLAGGLALLTLAFAAILPLMAIGVGAFAAFATGAAVAIGVFLTTLALQAPIMKKSVLVILQALIDTIVEAVPMVIDGIKRLFTAIKEQFSGGGEGGTKMQTMMGKSSESWIDKLKEGIKKKIPQIVSAGADLLMRFLDGLSKRAKELGAKGAELVANLIEGIGSRIDRIVDAAVDLIIKFADGIRNNYNKILDAGVEMIADFLHGLADTIRNGSRAIGSGITDVVDAMRDVGVDMIKGLLGGLESMVGDAMTAITDLAGRMIQAAKDKFKIFSPSRVFKSIGKFLVEGLTNGVQENAASAITAVASMVGGQIAVATAYISDFVQKLDQQAIAATAKAQGLAAAAETASRLAEKAAAKAEKTKGKGDDKKARKAGNSAEKLSDRAERAARASEKAIAKSEAAAAAEERAAQFAEADTFDKAKMRSEDAQNALDASKAAETRAAASLAEAAALEKQAKADGVTKKQRKEMLKQAEELRKAAKRQAEDANRQIKAAETAAGDALYLQKLAGDEAAAAFQAQFNQEAQDDANADAFEKLTSEEKAAERRRQAAALQAEANKDLQDAKALAYTDLEAANELAEEAMAQAEQARAYLDEAINYENEVAQGTGTSTVDTGGRVVNLDPTEAASIAFNRYADTYSDAAAAAAGGQHVEFNQYNTSPESLSPIELYRQSNNLLSFAADKLQPTG